MKIGTAEFRADTGGLVSFTFYTSFADTTVTRMIDETYYKFKILAPLHSIEIERPCSWPREIWMEVIDTYPNLNHEVDPIEATIDAYYDLLADKLLNSDKHKVTREIPILPSFV